MAGENRGGRDSWCWEGVEGEKSSDAMPGGSVVAPLEGQQARHPSRSGQVTVLGIKSLPEVL